MDLCCEYPFPGFTINDDTPNVDRLVCGEDGIVGLDGGPIRRQVDPKGQTDGGLVHDALFGPRVVVWKGLVVIESTDWELNDAYLSAVNILMQTVTQGLEGIINTPYNLVWTPSGLGQHSLSVKYGMPGGEIKFGGTMLKPTWTFQTISEDPAISIS